MYPVYKEGSISMRERKTITLPIGKTVDPIWNNKNIMVAIKVMPNMSLSLFENEVLDGQSIYNLERIVLVTKYKKQTEIPIKQVVLAADGSYRCYVTDDVNINRGELVLPRMKKKK